MANSLEGASPALAGGDDGTRLRSALGGALGGRGRAWAGHGAGQWWAPGVSAAVTLAVTCYRMTGPSLWRDEGATLAALHRSLPQLLQMLGHVDAVHGAYYFVMWFWVRVAGYGTVALRFPSALGMAAAAAVIAIIARRLVSAWAGLWAGLAFAAVPDVTWYAQNAREYAIVAAIAALASYLLIRVMDAAPGERRRWLIWYAVALAALGWGNLLALLLIPAHAVTVLVCRGDRRLLAGWLSAAAAAGVAVVPLVVLAKQQQNQVSWIKPPRLASFFSAGKLIGYPTLLETLILVALAGVAVAAARRRRGAAPGRPGRLVALAAPWLALPFPLLLGVSLIHPLYQPRYLVYCIPAAALLVGAALASLGRLGAAAGLAVIVFVALPAQVNARHASSHGENLRQLSHILAAHARPGDAVLFAGTNTREFKAAYPAGYRGLRDVGLGRTAIQSDTLTGLNAPAGVIRARLARVNRLWVVETGAVRGNVPLLDGLGFSQSRAWAVTGIKLVLLVR